MLFAARFLANQAPYNVHGPLVSMELQHALTLGGRPNSRVVIVVVLLKIQIRRIQIFVLEIKKSYRVLRLGLHRLRHRRVEDGEHPQLLQESEI